MTGPLPVQRTLPVRGRRPYRAARRSSICCLRCSRSKATVVLRRGNQVTAAAFRLGRLWPQVAAPRFLKGCARRAYFPAVEIYVTPTQPVHSSPRREPRRDGYRCDGVQRVPRQPRQDLRRQLRLCRDLDLVVLDCRRRFAERGAPAGLAHGAKMNTPALKWLQDASYPVTVDLLNQTIFTGQGEGLPAALPRAT